MATFTTLAFVFDPLIIFLCYRATTPTDIAPAAERRSAAVPPLPMPPQARPLALTLLLLFMLWTKVIKLLSLLLRNPCDIIFLPVSILFGYFHGFIKLYALLTLRMVCPCAPQPASLSSSSTLYPRNVYTMCPTDSRRHHGARAPMAIPTIPTA